LLILSGNGLQHFVRETQPEKAGNEINGDKYYVKENGAKHKG
jgi:hypothetical protein